MRRRLVLVAALGLLAAPALAAEAPEQVVPPSDRTGLSITLYQGETALIRDQRPVTLEKGAATLVWEGVTRRARTTTAILTGKDLRVQSQRFDTEGASGERLLADSVGKTVTLVWRDASGGERDERGRVLSAHGTPLFEVGGKVVAGQPARVIYDALPKGMRFGPAFSARVTAEAGGRRDMELAYMTQGLGWQADYVAELSPIGDKATLLGWTTLTNNSGADLSNAKVAVVAGQVNRAGGSEPMMRKSGVVMATASMAPQAAMPERESLGPYHLFTLPEPVTLRDGDSVQATLLAPVAIKVDRELVLDPLPPHAWRGRFGETPRQNPIAVLRLDNTAAAGLGKPLPSGTLRVYSRSPEGQLNFLGEDRINATPENGTARIAIGQAFDVTAQRSQIDYQQVSPGVSESAYRVTLANASDRPAQVTVREAFAGDWLVLDESQAHRRTDALSASWTTVVPAKGEAEIRYRVRVKG